MKKDGKWEHDISNHTCVNYNPNKTNNNVYPPISLNLFEAFKAAGSENIMGPFHLLKNGRNYPNFKMEIKRLLFDNRTAIPKEIQPIGVWNAGIDENNLLDIPTGKNLSAHKAETVFRIVTVEV